MDINIEQISNIYKNILENFYRKRYYKYYAKNEKGNTQSFIEHSSRTFKYAIMLYNILCELDGKYMANSNIEKITIAALLHDINKPLNIQNEVDIDINLIIKELVDSNFDPDYAYFIKACSIHKGRKNQSMLFNINTEEKILVEIVRLADSIASVSGIDNISNKIQNAVDQLYLRFLKKPPKVNFIKLYEVRLGITNIIVKSFCSYLESKGYRVLAVLEDGIVFIGDFAIKDVNFDELFEMFINVLLKENIFESLVSKSYDQGKRRIRSQTLLFILDIDTQIKCYRKVSEYLDIFNMVINKESSIFQSPFDSEESKRLRNVLQKEPDEIFSSVLSSLYIVYSINQAISTDKIINASANEMIDDIRKLLVENQLIPINVLNDITILSQKVISKGGMNYDIAVECILIADYLRTKVTQIDKFETLLWNEYKKIYKTYLDKSSEVNKRCGLLKSDLINYFKELLLLDIDDIDEIDNQNRIKTICPWCGRKIKEGTIRDKGVVDYVYSFRLPPRPIIVSNSGSNKARVKSELGPNDIPYICYVCYLNNLVENTYNLEDGEINLIAFNPVDIYFSDEILKFEEDLWMNTSYLPTRKGEYSIFINLLNEICAPTILRKKIKEAITEDLKRKYKNIADIEAIIDKNTKKNYFKYNLLKSNGSKLGNIINTLTSALIFANFFGYKIVLTDKKIFYNDQTDYVFKYDIATPNIRKLLNMTPEGIYKWDDVNRMLKLISSLYVINDIIGGSLDEKEIVTILNRILKNPLAIFSKVSFRSDEQRRTFRARMKDALLSETLHLSINTIINELNGGVEMIFLEKLAELQYSFWKPNYSASSYIYTLPLRTALTIIKKYPHESKEELCLIVTGGIKNLVERHANRKNDVYASITKENIKNIEDFSNLVVNKIFFEKAKGQVGRLSLLENYIAPAIEYLTFKLYQSNINEKKESEKK